MTLSFALTGDGPQWMPMTFRAASKQGAPRSNVVDATSIFPKIDDIVAGYRKKFRTSELNAILERAVTAYKPPAVRGKPRRFYYVTQLKSGPPTFALFSNVDEPLHFSYRRYLENVFRDELGLPGCPIHFVIRARKGMKRER